MAQSGRKRRGRKQTPTSESAHDRSSKYRQLRHPFTPQSVFSDDEVNSIHNTALRVLEDLGIKVLLPQAREIYARNDARLKDDMVFIGRDMVDACLQTAPKSMTIRAANPDRQQIYENGSMIFSPGAGCPNVTDLTRGRRPGSLESYIETIKLQQSFNVMHLLGPSSEPQDVPVQQRHYAMMQAQMQWADKPVNVYARGQKQVEQSFEMIQLGLNLSADEFAQGVWATGIINSNSPRMLDKPMAQGIIDFAKAGQISIISPFCLAGAMAPITVAGALTLQHAEALACIVLSQLTSPGAPVSYGGFSSNVDMKSGSPAFGTPEHIKMQIGGGQLARHIGLPWRSATGTASNVADAQGATETVNALWGALMGNVTWTIHAAGWLEGGLSFGYEKFINDIEALQVIAELCATSVADDEEIGFDAIADVAPAGHFFETPHTMSRYKDAFYRPLVAETTNFGSWEEAGSKSSEQRATVVWQRTLANYQQPDSGKVIEDRLANYVTKATEAGGAPPMD